MSSIFIASDSRNTAARMAERLGEATGYAVVGREVLDQASRRYEVPEELLVKALDQTPSFFGLSPKVRERCLSCIQAAALEELVRDKVACHGLGAHLYVKGVSHVLKVRVLAKPSDLAQELALGTEMSSGKTEKMVARAEKARQNWSRTFFKEDETSAGIYDLVVSLHQIEEDEAVDMIVRTASHRKFEAMTYSLGCMQELLMASQVRALLVPRFPDCRVRAESQTVVVYIKSLKRQKRKIASVVRETARSVPGVVHVEVHVIADFIGQAAQSQR